MNWSITKGIQALKVVLAALTVGALCALVTIPVTPASAATVEYECSYVTFKEKSVNLSCDLGIQHFATLYGKTIHGSRVDVHSNPDQAGEGVSRAPVLNAQIPYIKDPWTRVFH